MSSEFSERLQACILVEEKAAEIYRALGGHLQETKGFWEEMAREEETHALVLAVARNFQRDGSVPEKIAPSGLGPIQRSLDLAAKTLERISEGAPSLKEAVRMALGLEGTLAESYFIEAMGAKNASGVMAVLQHMAGESRQHVEKLREFAAMNGVSS